MRGESGHSPDLRLQRLLRPKNIAVVGGGAWCANVVRECRKIGFAGYVWPVHPTRGEVGGVAAFASVNDLPGAPDAVFIGVNRGATVEVLRALSALGAGGAVCFAAGFSEAQQELADGGDLQAALVEAAGEMPFLGPNCYGFVNALEGAALWPDQHGLVRAERGVAILTQSSNVALNLSMQARGLPIALIGTVGNQAAVDLARLGEAVLEDPRITALGLYIEGIRDVRGFERLAARARELGKRIVAMKLGASEQSARAAVSHTASLTGSDAGARALLRRCGVAQVSSLSALLETLKILHGVGPLASNRVGSMSCSGGEASLMADTGLAYPVAFPELDEVQRDGLRAVLGPKVALANPLDYNTYIWGDLPAMTGCFAAMMAGDVGLGTVVLDFPRGDRCSDADWLPVLDAVEGAARASGKPMAVLATLVDTLPEAVAESCFARGIVPLCDLPAALEAIGAAAFLGEPVCAEPVLQVEGAPPPVAFGDSPRRYLDQEEAGLLSEDRAKALLASVGVRVPGRVVVAGVEAAAEAARGIGFPVVLKGTGFAHKSEAGAVKLGLLSAEAVAAAAKDMGCDGFLVEEMVTGGVVELLVGVLRDPAHGFVLTLGAGGVMTEVLRDTVTMLLPVRPEEVRSALAQLRIAPVLAGWRGSLGVDMEGLVEAVMAVQRLVVAEVERIEEVEINPLICKADGVVAVDALIRLKEGN
ncbi:acetate--CoA ligase family protein [Sagittula sp. S175]|uniref:acetate--CoA ligase family protein n=1 Tax=Sagittula sp. S175 TaxID=3415129 RepID=UPI003C7A6EC4